VNQHAKVDNGTKRKIEEQFNIAGQQAPDSMDIDADGTFASSEEDINGKT
jgi:hypothetical protein